MQAAEYLNSHDLQGNKLVYTRMMPNPCRSTAYVSLCVSSSISSSFPFFLPKTNTYQFKEEEGKADPEYWGCPHFTLQAGSTQQTRTLLHSQFKGIVTPCKSKLSRRQQPNLWTSPRSPASLNIFITLTLSTLPTSCGYRLSRRNGERLERLNFADVLLHPIESVAT